MAAPVFLSFDEVIELHRMGVAFYRGSSELRDEHLLRSALGAVEATMFGKHLYSSLPEMAAAYFHGIVANHPFLDGNKRAGLLACERFLNKNGFELQLDGEEAAEITFQIAKGGLDRESLSALIEANLAPCSQAQR